ncbi:MAG: F0F1 ATP synthase subunit B [Verrucomicrobia bacterium]|jgi:F-type H+-transporting ATPase subunit b|nr:F0F1 ATP synthase subunit B [Verrucomicrobiota bacterium]
MNQFVLLASIGSDLAETARTTGEKFGVQTSLFVAQVISFLIVAALLYKLAYQPILKVLEERRQRIAESLANVEKIKQDLVNARAGAQEILNQASAHGNKLIEEARAAAAEVREQETQKAIAAAEQIIAKAREAAAQDHARMLVELKREVGRLVVHTTATVTGKILTPDDHRRLAEETTKQLAAK